MDNELIDLLLAGYILFLSLRLKDLRARVSALEKGYAVMASRLDREDSGKKD